ncbi:common central domain of tyrosinase-domain-containing protein [Paraphoma chrysanthemicola]|uniref:tyrosinase n=1 Tax=Paraphoma chrysanthemicola TaxID=798071 RepID=A0A8K0QVH6_9PLEO|nr:common central domain of tyrosinase-domain-containing protein [Paraphoma chrysanthemicola]
MATNPLKDANDKGIVKGLAEFGKVARRDVDELLHDEPDCFNLFLIALKQLQETKGTNKDEFTPWDDKMSFFQIAGIHGLPNAPWDNERGKSDVNATGAGYCAHRTQTFPTWHRPYLAMFEQALYKKMLDIVERYDSRNKPIYQQAVKKFRLPYWDYLRPRDYNAVFPGVARPDGLTSFPYDFRAPLILTMPEVTVRMYPGGKPTTILNPLSTFNFPDPSTNFFKPKDWAALWFDSTSPSGKQTLRLNVQRDDDSVRTLSDLDSLNAVLNIVRESTTRMSLNFLERGIYQNYREFSTVGADRERLRRPNFPTGSLEGLHGNYHGYIGGGGHMGAVTTAAFDPIFWLHHCQVDRYFAIWQGVNPQDPNKPENWFQRSSNPRATDYVPPNADLLPFRQPGGGYWNSNEVVKPETLGYTYNDIDGKSPQQVLEDYKNRYSWSRRLTVQNKTEVLEGRRPPAEANLEPLSLDDSPFFQKPDGKGFHAGYKPLNVAAPITFPKPSTRKGFAASQAGELQASIFSLAPEAQPEDFALKVEAVAEVQPTVSSAPEVKVPEEKVSREWYVDDQVQALALNGSFTILYLVGDFNQNTPLLDLRISPAFVGNTHVFAAPIEACDNCGRSEEQSLLVTNTNPLTDQLLDYVEIGTLESMRPEHVKPFLVANLKWRVIGPDGSRVDPRTLSESKDFKLSISCKIAPLPGQDGEVVYEQYDEISDEIIANSS